jgi:TonB family protein
MPGKRGPDMTRAAPIPLDTVDPKYANYLNLVRDKIRSNWRYPCVNNVSTGNCEYNSARLVVEFSVLKGGRVQFVHVRESSGLSPYDNAAVEAIKRSSPFPEVPAALMATMKEGSTGLAILVHFNYVLDTPSPR